MQKNRRRKMKQLWKKFDKLTEICYMSELDDECPEWDEAYEVFKELVAKGRDPFLFPLQQVL